MTTLVLTAADGFHVMQSQGFIKLEDCDFGCMGDDCVNIHDNIISGLTRVDGHSLLAKNLVLWKSPFAVGDLVEIRLGDFSPTGFTGKLREVRSEQGSDRTLVFEDELPATMQKNLVLFNHRFGSRNYIIRNCFFRENRARGVLCNSADGLVEGNHFFHSQSGAMHLQADLDPRWG